MAGPFATFWWKRSGQLVERTTQSCNTKGGNDHQEQKWNTRFMREKVNDCVVGRIRTCAGETPMDFKSIALTTRPRLLWINVKNVFNLHKMNLNRSLQVCLLRLINNLVFRPGCLLAAQTQETTPIQTLWNARKACYYPRSCSYVFSENKRGINAWNF